MPSLWGESRGTFGRFLSFSSVLSRHSPKMSYAIFWKMSNFDAKKYWKMSNFDAKKYWKMSVFDDKKYWKMADWNQRRRWFHRRHLIYLETCHDSPFFVIDRSKTMNRAFRWRGTFKRKHLTFLDGKKPRENEIIVFLMRGVKTRFKMEDQRNADAENHRSYREISWVC